MITRCPDCEATVNRPGYPSLWDHVKTRHISPEVTRHRATCQKEKS